ncbi:disease resistance protein RPS4B-like [Tripterygium wilfordii]|uniref:disease resistance protein RPS4B-like n=1 Tax=Tripterygium wilfordii TaxID=458696 RepID=UPI0018F8201F|nr:disease resistance protein RPS4B-like [Tripterygium wilfordii]
MVASPSPTASRGVFDSYKDQTNIVFDFQNCWKLDQNARNSIVAEVESKLLYLRTNYPESKVVSLSPPRWKTVEARIIFPGGDVPDWFSYKSKGSSLTAKLPPHWFNAELFSFVCSVVFECNDIPKYSIRYRFNYNGHIIRTNRGDSSSANMEFIWRSQDAIRSNQVVLTYDSKWINTWRRILEEADDVDEISIEFDVKEDGRNYSKVKGCGFHLLYTHDIENRHGHSVVQSNSPCGDLTQFFLNQDCVDDDIEESAIQDAKDNGCHNVPMEDSAPVWGRKRKRS